MLNRTDGRALDARDNSLENSSYTGVAFNTPDEPCAKSARLRSIDGEDRNIFNEVVGLLSYTKILYGSHSDPLR